MWLFKTEPTDYSFMRLQKAGKAFWDGVKNPLALKHLRSVKKGDAIFIYHTGDEKSIVGIAKAVADSKGDGVEISAVKLLAKPVSLAAVKADSRFKDFALVKMSRLSVMPVSEPQWKALLEMAS